MQNGKIRQAKIVLGDMVVKGVLPHATKIYIKEFGIKKIVFLWSFEPCGC